MHVGNARLTVLLPCSLVICFSEIQPNLFLQGNSARGLVGYLTAYLNNSGSRSFLRSPAGAGARRIDQYINVIFWELGVDEDRARWLR